MDKLPEHPLSHVVVGNNTLAQGTDGDNVAGGAARHSLGVRAHLQKLARVLVHGHHGRLAKDYALPLDKHQDGGGTQVDSNIFTKHF